MGAIQITVNEPSLNRLGKMKLLKYNDGFHFEYLPKPYLIRQYIGVINKPDFQFSKVLESPIPSKWFLQHYLCLYLFVDGWMCIVKKRPVANGNFDKTYVGVECMYRRQ